MKRITKKRATLRDPTEAPIMCRPLAVGNTDREAEGLMRNFSSQGAYIESSDKYTSGTILIMRIVRYPSMQSSKCEDERPRSIGLVEVRWLQELDDKDAVRYGIGLRYLD